MSGGEGRPVVGLGESQIGEAAIEATGRDRHTTTYGADPARLVELMEMLVKNAWDDRQQRDVRQNEVDFHREMTRQRLERIADDVAAVRRWLIGLTLAGVLMAGVLAAVVADRLLGGALALVAAAVLAMLRGR